ncbi:MAG: hypothetical protein A2X64_04305 [Ignavibacteria bacterium GWF2_33_9]|nr:MAG: hypothetical protein A2X64_04305 [Ignavibacteria bacterium GWF2_33_9]
MKKIRNYLFFPFFFIILNFNGNVLCQDTLQTIEITLTGLTGTYLPAFTRGFLKEYNDVLGGQKKDLTHNFSFAAMLGCQWQKEFRITLKSCYIEAHLYDDFIKETFDGTNQWRTFVENIRIVSVPIIANYDWYYFFDKYKSYLSGGIGLVYSGIQWNELVQSPLQHDLRVGGDIFNEYTFYPAISIVSGVQLDFDEYSVSKFFRGITISTEFLYIFRQTDIFANLRQQIVPLPEELNGTKSVLPILVGINFGLVLNLENKKLNRIFGNK